MILSEEQIRKRVQTRRTPQGASGLEGVGVGIGKGIISTFKGISSLGEKGLRGAFRTVLPKSAERRLGIADRTQETAAEQFIPEELTTARGRAEKLGFGIEQIGEFFVPASASLKIGKAVSGASRLAKAGKVTRGAARLGSIGATEGVLGTGQSAFQSGKLDKEEFGVGAFSLIAPALLAGGGKALSKAVPKPVRSKITESISKAIKPSKKSIENPKYMDVAIDAFQTLKRTAGDTPPSTVSETLDTLRQAKKDVYQRYSDIAQQTGQTGAKFDPSRAMADLSNWIKDKGYSAGIKNHVKSRIRELADLSGKNPTQIQDRIEELNKSIPWGNLNNKVIAQVDASIANRLRRDLDQLIVNTTGQPYQAIRSEYANLRAIQDDLARTVAREARKNKAGFFDLSDIFTGGDLLAGVLTNNPVNLIRGLTGRGIKEYVKYINSPNTNLRRVFKLLDRVPGAERPSTFGTQRLLNEGVPGRVENAVPINLGARSQSALDATEVGRANTQTLNRELQNTLAPSNRQLLPPGTGATTPIPLGARSQSTIDAQELQRLKGNGAATPKTAGLFVKKPTTQVNAKEFAKTNLKTEPLIQEARKYKSAEEFVDSQQRFFHGTNKDFEVFDIDKVATGVQGTGFNFVSDKKLAQTFGKNIKERFVSLDNPLDISGKITKAEAGKLNKVFPEFEFVEGDVGSSVVKLMQSKGLLEKDIISRMQKAGFDGFLSKGANEKEIRVVFSPDQIKTKSQLIDIWNKANKLTK